MIKIDLQLDKGVPQYGCSSCINCQSIFGRSLCSVKNRGCCWYFPKFTMYEIHKMSKSEEGLKTLKKIISIPKVKIYNYYIHAVGYFDELGYKEYMKTEEAYDTDIKDKSIFFRVCPFVKPGEGCTLSSEYRSFVCNFFICDEVVKNIEKYDEFNRYINQRNSYIKWIEWENVSLEIFFAEKKLNLINNFDEIIDILKKVPLREYEFGNLNPIVVLDDLSNNAS